MATNPLPGDARASWTDADAARFSAIGLHMWEQDGVTHGRVEVTREFLAPGTDRVRVGVLATLVDQVGGTLPTGPINPTVDLRLRLLDAPPSSGAIHLASNPVKLGARLYVGEVVLDAGDPARPFAVSTVTFINQPIPGTGPGYGASLRHPLGFRSYDDTLQLRFPDATTAEVDPHPWLMNPIYGTFLGGAQVLLAELAAEHALAAHGAHRVVDLDMRFVNRSGPTRLVATADRVAGPFDEHAVRVAIRSGGDDARIVSLASVRCRPVG